MADLTGNTSSVSDWGPGYLLSQKRSCKWCWCWWWRWWECWECETWRCCDQMWGGSGVRRVTTLVTLPGSRGEVTGDGVSTAGQQEPTVSTAQWTRLGGQVTYIHISVLCYCTCSIEISVVIPWMNKIPILSLLGHCHGINSVISFLSMRVKDFQLMSSVSALCSESLSQSWYWHSDWEWESDQEIVSVSGFIIKS